MLLLSQSKGIGKTHITALKFYWIAVLEKKNIIKNPIGTWHHHINLVLKSSPTGAQVFFQLSSWITDPGLETPQLRKPSTKGQPSSPGQHALQNQADRSPPRGFVPSCGTLEWGNLKVSLGINAGLLMNWDVKELFHFKQHHEITASLI